MGQPILDPEPARPLTSREISKILGAFLGGLCDWCEPKEVRDALDFWSEEGFDLLLAALETGRQQAREIIRRTQHP